MCGRAEGVYSAHIGSRRSAEKHAANRPERAKRRLKKKVLLGGKEERDEAQVG
jgi:hypothetical protein